MCYNYYGKAFSVVKYISYPRSPSFISLMLNAVLISHPDTLPPPLYDSIEAPSHSLQISQ